MIKKSLFVFSIFISVLFAKNTISIEEVLKESFEDRNISVEKKSLILTKEDVKTIQSNAHSKVDSKVVRYYKITKDNTPLGNAILLKKRVRTKIAAILYIVDNNNSMLGIEILSFKEPSEYKPSQEWQKMLVGKTAEDTLVAGDDIPTISGATLSARAISNSARLALSIAQSKLK
ncbi:MAG TPA: FMN-binding protein [Campylobacterales bacterium]|nr:FMN-binding protein [Campylobacterales bacterium]HHS93420.1 FMN-binding protein [Campylobacterales bacterium]